MTVTAKIGVEQLSPVDHSVTIEVRSGVAIVSPESPTEGVAGQLTRVRESHTEEGGDGPTRRTVRLRSIDGASPRRLPMIRVPG
jgi:hypothetical protein